MCRVLGIAFPVSVVDTVSFVTSLVAVSEVGTAVLTRVPDLCRVRSLGGHASSIHPSVRTLVLHLTGRTPRIQRAVGSDTGRDLFQLDWAVYVSAELHHAVTFHLLHFVRSITGLTTGIDGIGGQVFGKLSCPLVP